MNESPNVTAQDIKFNHMSTKITKFISDFLNYTSIARLFWVGKFLQIGLFKLFEGDKPYESSKALSNA